MFLNLEIPTSCNRPPFILSTISRVHNSLADVWWFLVQASRLFLSISALILIKELYISYTTKAKLGWILPTRPPKQVQRRWCYVLDLGACLERRNFFFHLLISIIAFYRFRKPWCAIFPMNVILAYLCDTQNDFSMFGFKFESKTPVPIDSLITNLAETAYVVSRTWRRWRIFADTIDSQHPWVAKSHIRWLWVFACNVFCFFLFWSKPVDSISDYVIRRILWILTGQANSALRAVFPITFFF